MLPNSKLRELIDAAVRADGRAPFSDGSLAELATGARRVVWLGPAAALVSETEAEFVVHPDARRLRHGAAMLNELLTAAPGELLLWAHGAHPAARRLAATHGLEPVRELLRLRAEVAAGADGRELREGAHSAPRLGAISRNSPDWKHAVAALLELNGRAFAEHSEQGQLTRKQFDVLAAEPWFDAADVLLMWSATDPRALLGFCWLKVESATGEFYVVAVDPTHRGEGLGRRLMTAGFERLAERGIREAILYVEADNTAALRLYREFGFREDSIDIQYRWASEPDD